MKKIAAILEVLGVFALIFFLFFLFRTTHLWKLQRTYLKSEFLNSALMFAVPIIVLLITRRNLSEYGLRFTNLKKQLVTALICLIPVAAANMTFSFVDWTSRTGALVLAADHVVLLVVLALLLRKEPPRALIIAFGIAFFGFIAFFSFSRPPVPGMWSEKLLKIVYYLFFVGFGEEMLNRGYIQSRLNAVFGRPFEFRGVKWGWGIVIASIIFGAGHLFNHFNPFLGEFNIMWWWASWTIFSGLVFGFLREKTGGILVPAIVHGLPLAVASYFFGI